MSNSSCSSSSNPTETWKLLEKDQRVLKLKVSPPSTPVANNMLRFVCMSDTHSLTSHVKFDIPDGDIFIHAGDFSRCGTKREIEDFNQWLGTLPHKYKIVIAGNHELSFDPKFQFTVHKGSHSPNAENIQDPNSPMSNISAEAVLQEPPRKNNAELLTNATYLQDDLISICGIKIYGSPWQPEFLNWAFNLPRGEEILEKWQMIPDSVDILLTHGPPLGHGDLCVTDVRAGCADLLTEVQKRIKPKYHVFGHIHEGYGVTSDGKTIFVNASTCDVHYSPCNLPIVFDVPIPDGLQK